LPANNILWETKLVFLLILFFIVDDEHLSAVQGQ